MVYYYKSERDALIYMGKDKHENEHLIKYGTDRDIWFHAKTLSSAHVYLRMPDTILEWTQITNDLLMDCAHLTKYNSIEGSKRDTLTIIYTPWSNLLKLPRMETGQVSFRNEKLVKRITVNVKKDTLILNRLSKTKWELADNVEKTLELEQRDYLRSMKQLERDRVKREFDAEQLRVQQLKELAGERGYDSVMASVDKNIPLVASEYIDEKTGDVDIDAFEEDFM